VGRSSHALIAVTDLTDRLNDVSIRDRERLRRRLAGVRRIADADARLVAQGEVAAAIEDAAMRLQRRRLAVPALRYPDELPVVARREELLRVMAEHQVVIVAGDTGSGKSTQLPKLCLELGRGVAGLIGHTQPRRIAARTVAERVAEELGGPVGGVVGYTVRFTDEVGDDTLVKVMTDGILLNEIRQDRMLYAYDTIIVDEAHERSLNIDFILGYLTRLLPQRPDLKVIVTSATIDTERFAAHFGGAPVVEVSGRTFPVELRYRPLGSYEAEGEGEDEAAKDDEPDVLRAITDAVGELSAEGPGDILVFLSGEREIRDAAEAVSKLGLPGIEVVPLYSRLSLAEQHRVFESHQGRRVVLATNVAETSLTVPGVRYVVDPGTARISRYSYRTKVQRLPIEAISQASANQRAGRCGRVAPGVCIRLYDEADFASRPEYTDPEILRTNLASVVLQMAAVGLGEVATFPFVDRPDPRGVADGIALLEELGALEAAAGPRVRLTPLGRRLAQLPLDPRLGRMVLEAEGGQCLDEVLIITAALSIQDPRERPAAKQQEADEAHGRFADKDSDFFALVHLWRYLAEQQRQLSGNQFRKLCRNEYLNYLRVREWQDIYSQLRRVAHQLGVRINKVPAQPAVVHRALLAGLLSHIGVRAGERTDYRGSRNARFALWPGSALAKKPPRWVMAAELVETSRLWGRVVARIEPQWAERLGAHLLQHTFSDPWWDPERGSSLVYERATLFGVPVVAQRRADFARLDPSGARALFLQRGLVEGEWRDAPELVAENLARLEQARALEDRARRRSGLSAATLFAFYDRQVPPEVTSGRAFERWWRSLRRRAPDWLRFDPDLGDAEGERIDPAEYPEAWTSGPVSLPLRYAWQPGEESDGVTVDVPLPLLEQVGGAHFDWQVPGVRHELVVELIRTLPKPLRRHAVPVPDYARAFLDAARPEDGPLIEVLAETLSKLTGVAIGAGDFDLSKLPAHLRLTIRVVDESGRVLATGKDLAALRKRLRRAVRHVIAEATESRPRGTSPGGGETDDHPPGDGEGLERRGVRRWDFGQLPAVVTPEWQGHRLVGYPALVDEGDSVAIRVLATEGEQQEVSRSGVRRLLLLGVPSPAHELQRLLDNRARLALAGSPYGSVTQLLADCTVAAVDQLMGPEAAHVRDGAAFERLRSEVAAGLPPTAVRLVRAALGCLERYRSIQSRLQAITAPALAPAVADMDRQLHGLVYPGFVAEVGARLPELDRYLHGIEVRLDKLADQPRRDQERQSIVNDLERALERAKATAQPGTSPEAQREVRWMIEELRISLFAQSLGARGRISAARIQRSIAAL
jgi:ATP-dependent helicase HrpA